MTMADNNMNVNAENEELEAYVITLTDEETGEDKDFEVLADEIIDGKRYFALVEADDEDTDEYVILKAVEDGEDLIFETIEDDDEFEKAEDYFNDLLFGEVDYDEQ